MALDFLAQSGPPNPVHKTPHHTINEWHILDIIICLFWCIWQIVNNCKYFFYDGQYCLKDFISVDSFVGLSIGHMQYLLFCRSLTSIILGNRASIVEKSIQIIL